MPENTIQRDPKVERLWFTITPELRDEKGGPDFQWPHACLRHHGTVVAYYGGWNGTYETARQCAEDSITDRVNFLCGAPAQEDYPSGLNKGPEDY